MISSSEEPGREKKKNTKKKNSKTLGRTWKNYFVLIRNRAQTPWTLQSMEFSRPEYWSGQPVPSPGDLPNPGIEPRSSALQEDSLPVEPQGKPQNTGMVSLCLLQQIFLTQKSNQEYLTQLGLYSWLFNLEFPAPILYCFTASIILSPGDNLIMRFKNLEGFYSYRNHGKYLQDEYIILI